MTRLIAALGFALLLSGCSLWGNSGSYSGYGQRNGMFLASSDVDNSCISPKLQSAIASFERKFGRKIVVSSGYRDPIRNIIADGQDSSYHVECMAVDFFMPGIDKGRLIAFAMRNPTGGRPRLLSGTPVHPYRRARPAARLEPAGYLLGLLKALGGREIALASPDEPPYTDPTAAPFVYRLGRHPFTVQRGVRFP